MAKFDQAYFDVLCNWLRGADNGWYDTKAPALGFICSNLERFVGHLKWYEQKNKDDRYIYLWQQSETELMYGVKFCKFYLGDIFYPGCLNYDGSVSDDVIKQKMDRIWKQLGEIDRPKPTFQERVQETIKTKKTTQKGLFK